MAVLASSDLRLSLVERLVRRIGWSPVGRRISLKVDETFGSELGARYAATIASYGVVNTAWGDKSNGENRSECVLARLDSPIDLMGQRLDRVLAVPRHTGCGIYSLPVARSIAVYVTATDRDEIDALLSADKILGIWSLRLG